MHTHGPNDLAGPLRGSRGWWRGLAPQVREPGSPPAAESTNGETSPGGTDAPLRPTETQPQSSKPRDSKEGGIRRGLVDRVRRQIAAGDYDTQAKWDAALDRLLDRLQEDD